MAPQGAKAAWGSAELCEGGWATGGGGPGRSGGASRTGRHIEAAERQADRVGGAASRGVRRSGDKQVEATWGAVVVVQK
jgi:hypothetical protein